MKSPLSISACLAVTLLLGAGCVTQDQYDKVVRRNQIQQERIRELEDAREAERQRAQRLQNQYDLNSQRDNLTLQEIQALQAALEAKQAIIDELAAQMGTNPLPVELSSALSEWARQAGADVVSFDEKTGSVRFKSDLLFAKGSDQVDTGVREQLVKLSEILNGQSAEDFDVLIVGHTDDIPIKKPDTKRKHPTNLHLSAHRAIAVESVLAEATVSRNRMVVVGCGETRPIAPNRGPSRGNPANRRVEIYIVPAGQFTADVQTASIPRLAQ